MGYLKTLTQTNGVTGSYWRIYSVDLLRPDTQEIIVTLANYVDQPAASANPNGVLSFQQIHIQGADYPAIIDEISNLYAKIYNTINTLPVSTDSNQPTVNNTYFLDAKSDISVIPIVADSLITATPIT